MATLDIDFEGTLDNSSTSTEANETKANPDDNNTTHLDGNDTTDVTDKDNNNNNDDNSSENNNNNGDDNSNDSSTGELAAGDTVEFDGVTYTVAENGDIVDDKGTVFVAAKDVAEWLQNLEVENGNNEEPDKGLNIEDIQKAVGIEVTDDNNNPVSFTNDPAGVKSYIDSVIDIRSKELQEAAINKLYSDVPILKEFTDYLIANNGDYRGFGQLRDRSGIQVDKDNINQQKAIIKAAAREFNNPTINDSYIKYLEESGNLYDEAVLQLGELVKKDNAIKQQIAQQAEAARQQEAENKRVYFDTVNRIISSRNIAGYKIPDTFVKEVDGKKISLSTSDFYDYVAKPIYKDQNNNPITGYQRDLDAMSDEDLLNSELLDAYLKFTGSSIKDLVQMVATENEVRKLKLRSKEIRTTKTVKINKANKKVSTDDIILA